jgi:omega-amidase
MDNLKVTLIQTNIIWENIDANLKRYEEEHLSKINVDTTDLILFPELFSTGFSMKTDKLAEKMDGLTINWMQKWATKLNTQIGGSLIIKENDQYFNRFVIVSKDGVESQYDKKHLFRMGEENTHFTAGHKRIVYTLKGWKILLQVCYDLRFPVYSRNKTIDGQKEYDAAIYVANWPEVRSNIWSVLLRARAIENQIFCIGLNRIGIDGKDVNHSGNSTIINPWGQTTYDTANNVEKITTILLKSEILTTINNNFPAYLDADTYHLTVK